MAVESEHILKWALLAVVFCAIASSLWHDMLSVSCSEKAPRRHMKVVSLKSLPNGISDRKDSNDTRNLSTAPRMRKPVRNTAILPCDYAPVVYGHVHVAKTAGTSLNGIMALNHERVCGHKGNSHDYVQAQARNSPGLIGRYFKTYGPMRVPQQILDAAGYEDCDWISLECDWRVWKRTKDAVDRPLELHIPCRDPVDHLLSQCNYKNMRFNPNRPLACLVEFNRYSDDFEHFASVKCFAATSVDLYIEHMEARGVCRKRVQSEHVFRATNKPRGNDTLTAEHRNIALKALMTQPYYQFCKRCMNSTDRLV